MVQNRRRVSVQNDLRLVKIRLAGQPPMRKLTEE